MTELVELTVFDLGLAALLMLVPAGISLGLRLGITRRLTVATVRMVAQLGLVGLVLRWVFALDKWFYVVPVLLVMLTAAAVAGVNRSDHRFPGAYVGSFGSLVLASSMTVFSMTELVIRVDPWYSPQYVIPLVGMVLGNGLTGISLGLDRMLKDFVAHRNSIEARLSLGASLWTALQPWVRDAVRSGMVPIVNSMMVIGLVSLPGMMTGQILAGEDPVNAVAYQILIMFMIAACTALGTIGICMLGYWKLADPYERVKWESIYKTGQ